MFFVPSRSEEISPTVTTTYFWKITTKSFISYVFRHIVVLMDEHRQFDINCKNLKNIKTKFLAFVAPWSSLFPSNIFSHFLRKSEGCSALHSAAISPNPSAPLNLRPRQSVFLSTCNPLFQNHRNIYSISSYTNDFLKHPFFRNCFYCLLCVIIPICTLLRTTEED